VDIGDRDDGAAAREAFGPARVARDRCDRFVSVEQGIGNGRANAAGGAEDDVHGRAFFSGPCWAHGVVPYRFLAMRLLERLEAAFRGAFAPFSRASLSPMAMACFRLFTVRPEPLFRVPFFRRCMADFTVLDAFFPYFAMSDPCDGRGTPRLRADPFLR
jgi:hypothetical protein